MTDAGHRLAMVEAAIAGNPAFEASRVELDRPGRRTRSRRSRRSRPRATADAWLIVSSEALAGFPRWREPDRILELARVAVVPRGGFEPLGEAWVGSQFPGREDRFTFLSGPLLPISGSVVRRRAAAGRSVRYLVPEAVAAYIARNRLYAEPA